MATKRIELPGDNWAVINNDPKQKHMRRLVALQLRSAPGLDREGNPRPMSEANAEAAADLPAAAVAAYVEEWSLTDEAGAIPVSEGDINERVRGSVIDALYRAIDSFIDETTPKPPNALTPRPKSKTRGARKN